MYFVTAQDSILALETRENALAVGESLANTSGVGDGTFASTLNHGTEDTGVRQMPGIEGACTNAVIQIVRQ